MSTSFTSTQEERLKAVFDEIYELSRGAGLIVKMTEMAIDMQEYGAQQIPICDLTDILEDIANRIGEVESKAFDFKDEPEYIFLEKKAS